MSIPRRDNCKNCGVKLDETNFVYSGTSRLNSCRDCYNKYKRRVNKANYHDHVGRVREWHKNYSLKKRYNLNRSQYDYKLALQLGGCAICKLPFGEDRKIATDHDHATGANRDLLCYRCNSVLGLLQDNEDMVWKVLEYLKRHAIKFA